MASAIFRHPSAKHRSGLAWFFLSLVLRPFATFLIVVLAKGEPPLPPTGGKQRCRGCRLAAGGRLRSLGRRMTPSGMRVWICRRYGGPEVLACETRPVPEPRAGEVLVRIVATTVAVG